MRTILSRPDVPARLRRPLVLVAAAGSLAMVFTTAVSCPLQTEFFRLNGAREIHFGFLAGLPLVMLALQFAGAAAVSRLPRRKPLFMVSMIVSRLLPAPMVLLPALFPAADPDRLLAAMIVISAVSALGATISMPLWYAWMSDLIPHQFLNRYWGVRQRWMFLTWAGSYAAIVLVTYCVRLPATALFPILVAVGVIAGVVDILLFISVPEPPPEMHPERRFAATLGEPFRHREYGSFVSFSCAWHASVMFAAAFMQVYVLKVLGVPVWQAALAWCMAGMGNAAAAKAWGRVADRHGHRPVLVICVALKPLVLIAFLLLTPGSFLWVLPVVFFVDGMWNAGIMVATNGYMMKIAPRQNRSTFIACITGLAGLCGGLAAMGAGVFLSRFAAFSRTALGREWSNYHLLFAVGMALRLGCIPLVLRVREARSSEPLRVLSDILGLWPMRFLRFPLGLYYRNDDKPAP